MVDVNNRPPQKFGPDNRPTDAQLDELAAYHKVARSDICVICGKKIIVQVFRNSGVCCEKHRKDRDNDHAPFRGGVRSP
jgi:hypothetical protein